MDRGGEHLNEHLVDRADLLGVITTFRCWSLASRDAVAIGRRALDAVASVLHVPLAGIGRWTGDRSLTLVEAHAAPGWEPEACFEVSGSSPGTGPECGLPGVDPGVWRMSVGGFWVPPPASAWGEGVSVGVPISVGAQPWGRLGVTAPAPRRFARAEVDFLCEIADLLGVALERELARRLQSATSEFGLFALQSSDLDVTFARAVAVVQEVLEVPMAALVRRKAPGRMEVVDARGVPGWARGVGFDVPEQLRAREHTAQALVRHDWPRERVLTLPVALAEAGVISSVAASVLIGDGAWGRLAGLDVWPRVFTDGEIDFVEAMAHLLAAVIERHEVERRLRETTRQLQEALLPTELPELPGLLVAGRYVVVGGHQVGGDWFDVFPLPQGGVGLVIGDVEGHDSTAASVMGQIRNVLRAYASERHTPEEVIGRVNAFVVERTNRLASCLYAELHPLERTLTFVSAGHQAPIAVDGDLVRVALEVEPGLMLGAERGYRYTERSVILPPEATLILATDGVLGGSRPLHSTSDAVLAVLRRHLAAGHRGGGPQDGESPLSGKDSGMDAAVSELVEPGLSPGDDAAALLVRMLPYPLRAGGQDVVRRGFRSHASAPPAARRFLMDVLIQWGLHDLLDSASLVVSEVVTNAVIHTTGPIELVAHRAGPGRLWLGVRDDSDREPAAAAPDVDDIGGRGLAIVEVLADRWGSSPVPGRGGKTVWAELSITEGTLALPEDTPPSRRAQLPASADAEADLPRSPAVRRVPRAPGRGVLSASPL